MDTPLKRIEEPLAERPQAPLDLAIIVQSAINSGRPMSELKEALDLAERMEAIRRESLFNAAFTAFKRDCPPIVRRTKDEYIKVTRNGVVQARMYASIHDIASAVDGPLIKHGLLYDWADAVLTPDYCIVRRFMLRHEAGYSRGTSSPPIPIEGGEAYKKIDAGRKATSASPQQRMGVADTYAMRYSMISGLGLTTCDEDDDGRLDAVDTKESGDIIDEAEARSIYDKLVELGPEVSWRILQAQGVKKVSELRSRQIDAVWADIKAQQGRTK